MAGHRIVIDFDTDATDIHIDAAIRQKFLELVHDKEIESFEMEFEF